MDGAPWDTEKRSWREGRVICEAPAISQPHLMRNLLLRKALCWGVFRAASYPACCGADKAKVPGSILPLAT